MSSVTFHLNTNYRNLLFSLAFNLSFVDFIDKIVIITHSQTVVLKHTMTRRNLQDAILV